MQLRAITKSLVGVVTGGAALLQIPVVCDGLKAMVTGHPHLVSALSAAILLAAILHNPQVVEILGIQRKETTTEVVPLASQGLPPQS